MKILFVCTGNTCRSLMAERYARKAAERLGLSGMEISSCGTFGTRFLQVPKTMQKLMHEEGIDISGHLSSPVTQEKVESADIVLVMEGRHKQELDSLFPGSREKVRLLKEYAGSGDGDIPDPIGQSERVYRDCFAEIQKYVDIIMTEKRVS